MAEENNSTRILIKKLENSKIWRDFEEHPNSLNGKNILENIDQYLASKNPNTTFVTTLISYRSTIFDMLLALIWKASFGSSSLSLIAVGGYGRGKLHPHSDLDILILADSSELNRYEKNIESFITCLWDLNIKLGHSVRSRQDCINLALEDVTIATNLLESRHIAGSFKNYSDLNRELFKTVFDNTKSFFQKKLHEQQLRYKRHGDTEYSLEPNIKEAPGGLRDIQLVDWISIHHFKTNNRQKLLSSNVLSESDLKLLINNENFLWRVRFQLHAISGRPDERLLFDHQSQIAKMFGFKDGAKRLAVEKFMQKYYQTVSSTRELTDMILKWFSENISPKEKSNTKRVKYDNKFLIEDGFLTTTDPKIFEMFPSALLEIFVILAEDPKIKGLKAIVIKQIRESRNLIDSNFRKNPVNKSLFIRLLKSKNNLTLQLRRMSRYGILGSYLPEFKKIIGLTQHDLFHVFPVDVHTVKVIENLVAFGTPNQNRTFLRASGIFSNLPNQEIILIAGLFHDIAKGRGGNHSELGAKIVRQFAIEHNLSDENIKLLEWLVLNHLLMSSVSQREDINDPQVIERFSEKVKNVVYLDLLYILTVADITATNPELWTDWKGALMGNLYLSTKKHLEFGLSVGESNTSIEKIKNDAMKLIPKTESKMKYLDELWLSFGDDFFSRETPNNLARYSEAILKNYLSNKPIILIKDIGDDTPIATEIFVYCKNQEMVFSKIARVLDRYQISIQDARLETTTNDHALDTFFVLDRQKNPIGEDAILCKNLKRDLSSSLLSELNMNVIAPLKVSRRLRQFKFKTSVTLTNDRSKKMTRLDLITPDRRGLLVHLSQIFLKHNVNLENAKIATLGEKVEDTFYVTQMKSRQSLNKEDSDKLINVICSELDMRNYEKASILNK